MNARDQIITLITSRKQIPKKEIMDWMAHGDLQTLGALYVLTDKGWDYIQPGLTMQEQCSFMRRYLMECLEKDPVETGGDDYLHSGFEAAWEIAAWMKHLKSTEGTAIILTEIACDLEALYRRADETTRNRIIAGALEHIFEDKQLVRLFDKWQNDPELQAGYEAALEWGKAHRS